MSGNIRIVIAEDNRLFREGLCMVLRPEKSIRIVGEAANGNEALSEADREMGERIEQAER